MTGDLQAFLSAKSGPPGDLLTRGAAVELRVPAIAVFTPAWADASIAKLSNDYMELALQVVAGYVSEKAPRNFGHLAQSFLGGKSSPTGGIRVLGQTVKSELTGRVFSSLPYAIVMNEGRYPGRGVSKAGIQAIGLWAQRKLGLEPEAATRAAHAIAVKIRRLGWPRDGRGVATLHFAERGMDAARPQVETLFAALADAIAQALGNGAAVPGTAGKAS